MSVYLCMREKWKDEKRAYKKDAEIVLISRCYREESKRYMKKKKKKKIIEQLREDIVN